MTLIEIIFCVNSPDAVIDPWLKKLWEIFLEIIPLPVGKEIVSSSIK
jgi:hypothetical protein